MQAKALLTEMTMHNGLHGCITCEESGEVVKQGKGHARVYPFRTEQLLPALRTTGEILKCGLEALESSKPVKGIKGVSCLHALDWFDIVNGLGPDYMHGTLIGLTKKMLQLLMTSSYSKHCFFIGNKIKLIDKRITQMKPTDQLVRMPRKLENNIGHLKASEFQIWLLFYSLLSMDGIMKAEYMNHFALLVEGIYILLGDNISSTALARAEGILHEFYAKFEHLYGKNNCTLNLHNIGHLTYYVKKLGPLWAWSCFPFENMNGNILTGVHGTGDVCRQVLWNIQATKKIVTDANYITDPRIKNVVDRLTSFGRRISIKHKTANCGIAGSLHSCTVGADISDQIRTVLSLTAGLGKFSKATRIVIGDTVFLSKEYSRMKKRVSYVVLINGNQPHAELAQHAESYIAEIQYFLLHHDTNTVVAVVCKLNIDMQNPQLHPSVNHLIKLESSKQEENVCLATEIKEKMLYLDGNKDKICVARLPNMYNVCS